MSLMDQSKELEYHLNQKKHIMLSGLIGLFLMTGIRPASADFEQRLKTSIEDHYLDKKEYLALQRFQSNCLDSEDCALAEHFNGFLKDKMDYMSIRYRYQIKGLDQTLLFDFAPTYFENQLIPGKTIPELLSHIAQRDILAVTEADSFRCTASALIAGHLIYYKSPSLLFQQLGLNNRPLTFQTLHLLQEYLYQQANTDKQPGLSIQIYYQVNKDKTVKIISQNGEVNSAAALMGFQLEPLNIKYADDLKNRQQIIVNLWKKYTHVPLLVGVHLNEQTGQIFPASTTHIENHSVLIFRSAPYIYMYNSGVLNNGDGSALSQLNFEELKRLLFYSKSSVLIMQKKGETLNY